MRDWWDRDAWVKAGTPADARLRKAYPATIEAVKADDGQVLSDRVLKFTITTGAVDRSGDVIDPTGWLLDDYRKNPVVMWAHDYSQPPIARALRIAGQGNGLVSLADFVPKDISPFADMIYQLAARGYLQAASVGFKPVDGAYALNDSKGVTFSKAALFEWSVVPIPANPEALMEAKGSGVDLAPLREWAEQCLDGAVGKGFWVARETLESVWKGAGKGGGKASSLPMVKAEWSVAEQNDLPDSSFAYIEPGGEKDADGKTTPRSKRHLPYKDADGTVDAAHTRNALARLDQTDAIPADEKPKVRAKLERALESVGGTPGKTAIKAEPAPGEEAAELIQYQSLAMMFSTLQSLVTAGTAHVAALIAAEMAEDPADEDAEDAVEDARCDAIRAIAGQMSSIATALLWAVQDLQADDPPMAMGPMCGAIRSTLAMTQALVQKSGRVISAANLARLQQATNHLQQASDHVQGVMADEQSRRGTAAIADEPLLYLADDPTEALIEVDPELLATLLSTRLSRAAAESGESLAQMVERVLAESLVTVTGQVT